MGENLISTITYQASRSKVNFTLFRDLSRMKTSIYIRPTLTKLDARLQRIILYRVEQKKWRLVDRFSDELLRDILGKDERGGTNGERSHPLPPAPASTSPSGF